jgi:hypothetical protein
MRAHVVLAYLAGVLLAANICGCSKDNPRVTTKVNLDASLTGSLPWNPLRGRVITSWIDPRGSTMSTLYGNDKAADYARTSSEHVYPTGAILAAVTWTQQEDKRWFGARIPSQPQSVEFVLVRKTSKDGTEYSYQKYVGTPLSQATITDGPTPNERAAFLLSQRAAVMP